MPLVFPGGKDSLTLLYGLANLQRFYPKSFRLSAITVDMGLDTMDLEPVKALCADFNVPYEVIPTEIGKILFEARKESNPCALCAKMQERCPEPEGNGAQLQQNRLCAP